MPPLANTIVAALLAVLIGAIAAHADIQGEQQDREATASRNWAARQKCGNRPHHWANDHTLVCAPHPKANP